MLNTLKKAILVFILAITTFGIAQAQIPSDLSRIKSSQITDAQLMQFVQKSK